MAGEEAVRNYKKGDEIETVILSIDPERERISWASNSWKVIPSAITWLRMTRLHRIRRGH